MIRQFDLRIARAELGTHIPDGLFHPRDVLGGHVSRTPYGKPAASNRRRVWATRTDIGVNLQAHKESLSLWLSETEGAKFWHSCLTDLKNRGVADIFVMCVDGLSGFPKTIRTAFPETKVQLVYRAPGVGCLEGRDRFG